ncbi:PEP-CTERM sorting domain-containing protein [Crocosphaera sp.]|uniref:PEP-CTERM sorting domain-containing protein n=1 Tax=Crocosphaera sp. TaxID=2729996 RepID=UPI003F23147F|nr:PEP-CTERM sorting domain-containing protein [Crocosphaera sp.]
MHNLNAYLNLTTTIVVSSLTVLAVNPAEAATWSRTLILGDVLGNDSYSNTNLGEDGQPINYGNSDFIQVGNFQNGIGTGDEQRGYLSWNLDELLAQIPAGSRIRNVTARLIMTQSNSDPDNPNDPDRQFDGVARVTLDGLDVTGAWDESMAIDPASPPSTIERPTLFSGQIDQGLNNYSGIEFNRLVSRVLNSNFNGNPNDDRNVLSIALRANNSLNFPGFDVFPVDSFWSQNQENPDLRPRLELDFEVWNEAHRITGGPNLSFYSRVGGDSNVNDNTSNGDWELSLGTKSLQNGQNRDNFQDQTDSDRQLTWTNGVNLPFELSCDSQTNQVTLTLNNDSSRSTSFTANNCQDIDGLKIFAQARETSKIGAGTISSIGVNRVRQIGSETTQLVTGLSALATAGGTQFVEDNFYFLDSLENGGLGFTNGVDLIRGNLAMAWPSDAPNPQAGNSGSRIQTQVIPLTRVDDPTLSPDNFAPQLAASQNFIPQLAASQPASDSSCSEPLPAELWQAIYNYDPSFLPEDSCGSLQIPSLNASNTPMLSNQQSVPEPSSILAFLLLGSTGMGVRLLKK